MSSRAILSPLAVLSVLAGIGLPAQADAGSVASDEPAREIYVPFEDLAGLLEGQPERVLLSRSEYETLARKAHREPKVDAPRAVMLVSADYAITVGQERAELVGTIAVEVLNDGLHAVDLDLNGVGLRAAVLDGKGAAIGHDEREGYRLFIQGVGHHELLLNMVARVETTAALQSLWFQVPTPPATRMRLAVPGNVEIKKGAYVVSRTFDEDAQMTRFELLPEPAAVSVVADEVGQVTRIQPAPETGTVSLTMTLNNRLLQSRRVVVARSVIVDEITQAYERLHATFSMAVLHRPVDRFRFALPDGFELTDVHSPLLSHWVVEPDGSTPVLQVQLREPTTETVLITLSGASTGADAGLGDWTLPRIEPLDVAGQVAVVGLLLEDRLEIARLTSEKLIPIDTTVLRDAFPATVFDRDAGEPRLRAVAAFYAPIGLGDTEMSGRFERPPASLSVVTSMTLMLEEKNLQVRGGFALRPQLEKLFAVDFSVPNGWHVTSVTDADGSELSFEVYDSGATEASRVRVHLPSGVAPGSEKEIYFQAMKTPADWLSDWVRTQVVLPVFGVVEASHDVGAIAVHGGEGMTVLPEILEDLTPLDQDEMASYGLAGMTASSGSLAYRYETQPYHATFRAERIVPRVTGRTYSFIRLDRDLLVAHYEIVYQIEEAPTRQLSLLLPATTPRDISIRAIGDVAIKEYEGTVVDGVRRWTIRLAEKHRDTVQLAVEFEQKLDNPDEKDLELPIVQVDGAVYQSGYVAVEGSPEIDLKVMSHPRKVDVGELAGATYRAEGSVLGPSRGGGVFAFVGDEPEVKVRIAQLPEYTLPSAIVQRAELVTLVSDDGLSQTAARFYLRAKAAFLQIELPEGSTLWSAELDGVPAKPQRDGGHLLLSLPAKADDTLCDLRMVYETPVEKVTFWGDLAASAPKLFLRAEGKDASGVEVPVADLDWHLHLPTGFEVIRHGGTVTGDRLPRPEPAAWTMGRFLYRLTGGVRLFYYLPKLSRARELSFRDVATASRVFSAERKERAQQSTPLASALPRAGAADVDEEKGEGQAVGGDRRLWALEGVRSLTINLEQSGRAVAFRSLGHDPRLTVTLTNNRRVASLAWGLALAIGVIGLALTNRAIRTKASYVVAVFLVGTLIPLLSGSSGLIHLANPAVYVVSALVPFYLSAQPLKWLAGVLRRAQPLPIATTSALVFAIVLGSTAHADPPHAGGQEDDPLHVRLVESAGPIEVPDDAIIVPYDLEMDPTATLDPNQTDRLLIPYRRYEELWNLAYPTDPLGVGETSSGYALAGAAFAATLEGDEYLTVDGYLEIDLYTAKPVAVPLELGGGVLGRAVLDGRPARLGLAPTEPADQRQTPVLQSGDVKAVPLSLRVEGKGRHRLDLTVRMKLVRQGGWSVVTGRLPAAPATALTLRVPRAGTEVRLGGLWDRRSHETTSPGEIIETALAANGLIRVEWRPEVREGYIDPSLTATSEALFDVREDGLRLTWEVNLDFGRTDRDAFTVIVPSDYLVQAIDGPNVRGWVTHPVGSADGGQQYQELEVTLLKPARGSGSVVVVLHRTVVIGDDVPSTLGVPVVRVAGAVLHKGRLTIRRSSFLNLKTSRATGVTRTDTSERAAELASRAGDGRESPLGVETYQAYRFAATPFDVELTAVAERPRPSVDVQSVLRIGERRRDFESRVNFSVGAHPIYRVRIVVPDDLKIDHVSVPAAFEWSLTTQRDRKILSVYLATGLQGRFSILIRGTLGEQKTIESLALPRLEVLGATNQRGDIVVQVVQAVDLQVAELEGCRRTTLERTYGWLAVEQRPLSRLALQYESPDYAGLLRLSPREALVTCSTITNVRVTESAVEETVLLDFDVKHAGVRSISFVLPNWMKDAHITLPMLRRKTVEPVSDAPDAPVRVSLRLQDDVMGRLRVLVENDRLLTAETQGAPVPTVETGRVQRRFVTLENAGRDELVIDELVGLEPLSHRRKEWRTLADMLGGSITQAYVVNDSDPLLRFKTKERVVVETAGARVGLAETLLVIDAHGAYRAAQSYRIDNQTEQFLDVELPVNARLWSTVVAGDPVKPARSPAAADPRRVRIPLIRTAGGDLDYMVVLKYGGRMPAPGGLRSVEFPLIRTVNVPVELSQVRLYLPETHRWVDFGGTMRRVDRESDLAAGFVRYQTRLTERLVRTMQGDSPFAQVRAASNLSSLKSRMDRYRRATRDYGYSRDLKKEILANEAVVRQAEEQSRQLARRPQDRGEVQDNRDRLNTLFESQKISRARNLVQDLPANFEQRERRAGQEQVGQQRFSSTWLDANRLSNVPAAGPDEDLAIEQLELALDAHDAKEVRQVPQGAREKRQARLDQSAERRGRRPGKKRRKAGRGGTDEAVAQYQQQLQKQDKGAQMFDFAEDEESPMPAEYDRSALARSEAGDLAEGGWSGAAGLASLAVEFPVRGVPYYFTTPRGEVAVTARAVSSRFIETVRRIGSTLVVIVIIGAACVALRKPSVLRLESRAWSTLLIALGFTGVVVGVLPVLGLAVIVVGVVARINVRRRERAAALA